MTSDYAGDISPEEAMAILQSDRSAVLVDVRTRPEWQFVGLPDLSSIGNPVILLEWQSYPTMSPNPAFIDTLEAELTKLEAPPDTPLLFLCRSGARSRSAAMAATGRGHAKSFNIAGGFEGAPDQEGHRGRLEGWKARQLPWAQT